MRMEPKVLTRRNIGESHWAPRRFGHVSSGLVHGQWVQCADLGARSVGGQHRPRLDEGRSLRRPGGVAGAGPLRLPSGRRHQHGRRRLRPVHGDDAQIRDARAEMRSHPADSAADPAHETHRHRRDDVDELLPPVHGGPDHDDAGPSDRRPGRAQRRHREFGPGGATVRLRRADAAQRALRDGRRMDGSRWCALGLVGGGRRPGGPGDAPLRRPHQGAPRRLRGQVLPHQGSAQHHSRPAAPTGHRAGRRLARRPGSGRQVCGVDAGTWHQHREHEGVPAGHAPPDEGVRPRPQHPEDPVPDRPDPRATATRSRRPAKRT